MKQYILSLLIICLLSISVTGCQTLTAVETSSPEIDTNADYLPETEPPTTEKDPDIQPPTTENESASEETKTPSPTIQEESDTLESKQIMSRLFFYDIDLDQMFYVNTEVEVIGGGYINSLTNALKNDTYGDHLITLADETFVTKAELDKEKGILTVYFNETFHKSMNLGSIAQVEMINALVNTYGYNYQVDKVAIIVEDKHYVDQRGEMPEGYFTVTSNEAVELN